MAVFYNKEETELVVTCKDNCGEAAHIKIDMEDDDMYCLVSYMNGNFYKEQYGALDVLKLKCKKIWAIIRNKDHYYSDVIMSKDEFDTFKKYINQF